MKDYNCVGVLVGRGTLFRLGRVSWEKIKGCEGSRRRYIEKAQVEYHPT